MMIASVAEKDRLRPWLGDILKGPQNGFRKSKLRTSFWPSAVTFTRFSSIYP
jgi:hypothetical protein